MSSQVNHAYEVLTDPVKRKVRRSDVKGPGSYANARARRNMIRTESGLHQTPAFPKLARVVLDSTQQPSTAHSSPTPTIRSLPLPFRTHSPCLTLYSGTFGANSGAVVPLDLAYSTTPSQGLTDSNEKWTGTSRRASLARLSLAIRSVRRLGLHQAWVSCPHSGCCRVRQQAAGYPRRWTAAGGFLRAI